MRLSIAALFLILLMAACSGQIAILKRHRVYILAVGPDGVPKLGAHPKLTYTSDWIDGIDWTPSGKLRLNDGSGSDDILEVQATLRGGPIRLSRSRLHTRFGIPIPSPNGAATLVEKVVVAATDAKPPQVDLYAVPKGAGKATLLARNIVNLPLWSPNSDAIAVVYRTSQGDAVRAVFDYPGLKVRFSQPCSDVSWWGEFSPDGRWISTYDPPLETRVVQLMDVKSGDIFDRSTVPGFQTDYIESWSPDSRHFIESYHAQDKEEHWTLGTLAITDITNRKSTAIPNTALAGAASYAADGRHIFFIERRDRRLVVAEARHPVRRTVLATNVDAFAVRLGRARSR
ncbi:MAG: hypothetical protein P4L46_19420 [Fimbriimonas sp.]|nr:hypothetical protein [Fimbriimonas sp.]